MNKKRYLDTIITVISVILLIELIILVSIAKNKPEVVANTINTDENQMEQAETNSENIESTEIEQTQKIEEIDISQIDGFYIKVNYLQNVVNIYIKDANGEYTRPYKAMICSTGKATPTSGVYKMSDRGKWGMMVGRVWAQYYSRINGQILFHSVPYTSKSPNKLEYWEYDKLGTSASAGCVRLTVEDAKWIYDNCPAGTQVEFYADSDPGPFGKPEVIKITEAAPNMRGWDPTDPNESNPWKNY